MHARTVPAGITDRLQREGLYARGEEEICQLDADNTRFHQVMKGGLTVLFDLLQSSSKRELANAHNN